MQATPISGWNLDAHSLSEASIHGVEELELGQTANKKSP